MASGGLDIWVFQRVFKKVISSGLNSLQQKRCSNSIWYFMILEFFFINIVYFFGGHAKPLEATRYHNSIKSSILLPVRPIYFHSFPNETPWISRYLLLSTLPGLRTHWWLSPPKVPSHPFPILSFLQHQPSIPHQSHLPCFLQTAKQSLPPFSKLEP